MESCSSAVFVSGSYVSVEAVTNNAVSGRPSPVVLLVQAVCSAAVALQLPDSRCCWRKLLCKTHYCVALTNTVREGSSENLRFHATNSSNNT
jgi:hypothetical protein